MFTDPSSTRERLLHNVNQTV